MFPRKLLMLAALGIAFTSTAHTMTFTREESAAFTAKVLAECQAPREIQEQVNILFEDPDALKFLINRHKNILIAGPANTRLGSHQSNPAVADEIARIIEKRNPRFTPEEEDDFLTRHDLVNLAPDGNTAAFTTSDWNFVIRVPLCDWYDTFVDESRLPLKASQYQNVSRVFYAKQINDFIKRKGFKYIHPFQQWLAHIPGRPTELSDANYLVVNWKIRNLPLVKLDAESPIEFIETNESRFADLVTQTLDRDMLPRVYSKCAWADLVEQLVQVISYAAMWDIKIHNVFLVMTHDLDYKLDMMKVVFLDTEKPGLGGGADEHFYHTHAGEVSSNLRTGMEGLAKIFVPNPTLHKAIENYNKQERAARSKMNAERDAMAAEDSRTQVREAAQAAASASEGQAGAGSCEKPAV
jgi:hypothetical protein